MPSFLPPLSSLRRSLKRHFLRRMGMRKPRTQHRLQRHSQPWQFLNLWLSRLCSRRLRRFGITVLISFVLAVLQVGSLHLWFAPPAHAATNLSIEPLTWDFIGLDSNNVNVGPNQYLTGARVCNIGTEVAQNVSVRFAREGAYNPYITVVNSLNSDTWSVDSIPPGALPQNHHRTASKPNNCFDAYYIVTVARNAAAHNTTQRFRIEATASNAATVDTNSFPDPGQYDTGHPRQLIVEKILSQARNDVLNFENLTSPGSTTVEVGGTYTFRLTSQTATAYPQLTISSDFPNVVFQLVNVSTTYSSDPGLRNSSIYANACGWISDPAYPGYRTSSSTCEYPLISDKDTNGDGKVGNTVVTEYTIKVLSTGAGNPSSQSFNINHLILDFSGGSYHYNADYGSSLGTGQTTITVVDRQADLSMTKTHTGNFAIGNNPYTLTVTNNGPNPARGPLTVTDTLPSGFSFVSASGTGWSCAANGQIVTCTNPNDLPVGSSTLNLVVNVSNSAATNSVNTATVASTTRDPNLANNTAADPTTVVQGPNLQLSKTHTPTTFVVGATGTYTLKVTNSSGFNAAGPLTIIDTLPTGLTYSSASGTNWSCSATGQIVTCTNPNGLNNSQTSEVNLTVNIGPSAATPSVTNTATMSSGSLDTNPTDNTANDVTPISKDLPDLTLTKTDNDQQFAVNQNGTYTLTVNNVGLVATANTITVVDTLPSSFTFVSATSAPGSTGWSCTASGSRVTCTNPNPLARGASSSILLTVRPTVTAAAPGLLNEASVSLAGEEFRTDNNAASDRTPVLASGGINLTVLKKLTKIAGAVVNPACTTSGQTDTCTATIRPGDSIEYTVDVTNNSSGSGDDANITMKDVVPSMITDVTWVCDYVDGANVPGGSTGNPSPFRASGSGNSINACDPTKTTGTPGTSNPPYRATGTGNNISLSTISLRKAGGKVRFTITGKVVTSGFTGTFANIAIATPSTASGADSNLADNIYTVSSIVPGADLSLSKTNFSNLVQGSNGVYRLTVTNTSSTQATTGLVTVQDVLPAALDYVSAASAPGSTGWSCAYDAATRRVICSNTNSLGPNTSSAIDLIVKPNASGSVTNNASVSSSGDINPNNNTAQVTTTVAPANPDLSITKADSGNFALGQEGIYVITVRNESTSGGQPTTVATGPITVTDTLPTGLSFLSGSGSGWVCSAVGQNVTCTNYSNLAPGASSSFNLKVLVGSNTPASVTNTAIVAAVNGEKVTTNNTSNALTTTIAQRADLAIAKTLSGSLITGQPATYQLTVTNQGPSAIPSGTAVSVTDTLPTGLTLVSVTGGGFSCGTSNPVTCTRTTGLKVGESATLTLTATVTASGNTNVTNTAQVTSNVPDPNTTNNTTDRSDTVQNQTTSLNLTKRHFGSFPMGGQGAYTLEVTNTGNSTITQTIKLEDVLPPNLTFAAVVGQNWTCTGTSTVICTTEDDLAPGARNAIDLIVNVGSGTPIGNNSVTNSARAFIGASTTPAATATDPTTITTSADLSLTKTATTALVVGQQAQYTLTVTNAATSSGPASAPITLEDQLPDGLTFVSASGTGWTCPTTSTSPDILCTFNSALAAGSSTTVTLTVQVQSTATSPVVNFAAVYSPTVDPNTANNTAIAMNNLGQPAPGGSAPKLLLVKRITAINDTRFTSVVDGINSPGSSNHVAPPYDGDDNNPNWPSQFLQGTIHSTIKPGDAIEFTMYFLSTGNTDAQNVLFCDLVPSNVTFIDTGFNTLTAANGPAPVPGTSDASGDRGIALGMGTKASTAPYPIQVSLSNTADGDAGRYVEPGIDLTSIDGRLASCGNNTNGAIVVNLGTRPRATSAGDPPGSYGFVRFKGLVQ